MGRFPAAKVVDAVGAQWELRPAMACTDHGSAVVRGPGSAGPRPISTWGVGAQWELRLVLARTDQRFARHEASVRAHVDRDLSQVDLPSGCFSNQNWQLPFRVEV